MNEVYLLLHFHPNIARISHLPPFYLLIFIVHFSANRGLSLVPLWEGNLNGVELGILNFVPISRFPDRGGFLN